MNLNSSQEDSACSTRVTENLLPGRARQANKHLCVQLREGLILTTRFNPKMPMIPLQEDNQNEGVG